MKYIFYTLLFLTVSCKKTPTNNAKMVLVDTIQKNRINNNIEPINNKSKITNLQKGLTNNDLCFVNNFYSKIDNSSNTNEQEFCLKSIINLTLISKKEFQGLLNSKSNLYISNRTKYSKNDTILELKTKNGSIKLIDKPDNEESMIINNYVGEVKFLNIYLISRNFWEDTDYIYLDKETGKMTNQFIDYPYISPNKNYIISLYSNGYEKSGDLTLHKITNKNTLELELTASFSRWMPALEPQECFWITDKQFVVKVLPSKSFWKKNGSYNDNFQYLKISIL